MERACSCWSIDLCVTCLYEEQNMCPNSTYVQRPNEAALQLVCTNIARPFRLSPHDLK